MEIPRTLTFHSNDVQLLDKTRNSLNKASSVWNEPQASPSAFIAAAQTCLVSSRPSQITSQPSQTISQVSLTHEGSTVSVLLEHSYGKPKNSSIAVDNRKNTTEYLRSKILNIDFESIIMGEKLSDIEVNIAHQMLRI